MVIKKYMVKKIVFLLQNIVSACVGTLICLIVIVPLLIVASLPKKWRYGNPVYYFFTYIFYKGLVLSTLVPISISGKEHIGQTPAIIIANHQSAFDIPLLGSLLGLRPHVWLFLARYAYVPIFGYITRRMNIVVDHRGLRKLVGAVHRALEVVGDHKSHILIFPEGGRYNDGKIHHFFYGFALLAKATGRPIVPVVMQGAGKVLPPRTFFLHMHPIKITIGEPIYFDKTTPDDKIVSTMQEWFEDHYQEKV
jgi:1-acyl-sn-glycerol-3-phosphate acyltransferase